MNCMGGKMDKKIIKICSFIVIILIVVLLAYITITQRIKIKKQERALLNIEMAFNSMDYENIKTKYDFIEPKIGLYIESLCNELELDSNLVFGILMQENPMFDSNAVNRNENGTLDVGLFQLNDRYLWADFEKRYWVQGIELDPFNWKHNCYIAVHHISYLKKSLKVNDDVIMAYNCGMGAVMKDRIPESTRFYLVKIKNNIHLLKEIKDDN